MASPFTIVLTPEDHSGRFRLNVGTVTYSIEFHPETDGELSHLLHSLHQAYTQQEETVVQSSLMREIGAKLWRVLMPETAPESCVALVQEVLRNTSQLRFMLPPS